MSRPLRKDSSQLSPVAPKRSQVPRLGELDNEETVSIFDNAKKGEKESKSNENDPHDVFKSEASDKKGSSERDTNQDESVSRRSVDSPQHTSPMDKKYTVENSQQKRGGMRSGGNTSESEAPKGRHEQQLGREEGDLRRSADSPVAHDSGMRRSSYDSPRHSGLSAGDTPRKATRQNAGSDLSVEQSPLHPHLQGRIGSQVTSSPSWERKVSTEGSHGQATSTPGRSRLRPVTRGDETPDHGTAVPKFGEWDDNDPASAEGFTQIFNKVQEEKQTGGGKVPIMPSESPYANGQMRDRYDNSKCCFCIPWGRR
ncbi:hypothetical protein LIER_02258 [Lithospermum erythrorhizon]|uniref:RIN4 pathogenic type III effector avirulence factor Avr cleavage site domain-containing protein n=1 Tax=Lithospermum erythrorhizon TaxID=34254 RepID=A0AAV3NSJ0_LITER